MEERLKHQIEQWQTEWQWYKELIYDRMKAKDYAGAYRYQTAACTLKRCIEDAYNVVKPN